MPNEPWKNPDGSWNQAYFEQNFTSRRSPGPIGEFIKEITRRGVSGVVDSTDLRGLDIRGSAASFAGMLDDVNASTLRLLTSAFNDSSFDPGRVNLELAANLNDPEAQAFMRDYMNGQNSRTFGNNNQYLLVHDQNQDRYLVYERKHDINGKDYGLNKTDYDNSATASDIVEAYNNSFVRPGGPAGSAPGVYKP